MAETSLFQPDLDFIRRLKETGGDSLKKCYQCATCSVVCKLSPVEKPFPRKEMLWANWGLKYKLVGDPDVWLCYQCNDCSVNCPRGAKPGDVLAAVRSYVYENYTFPSFMGRALSNPKAQFWLWLAPVLILFIILMAIHNWSFDLLNDAEVEYKHFFPHIYLETLFIGGNLLIFIFAAISLARFWKGLNHPAVQGGSVKFLPSLISTIIEVLLHKRFADCVQNKPRYLAHMLVFYGFIGAMITAGLAALLTTALPEVLQCEPSGLPYLLKYPIDLPHPVKILGVLSGLAIFIGGLLLIISRLKGREEVGADSYVDWLFLNVLFLTVLTGLLTYVTRLIGIPILAYATYFVHLVIVFFLLWYAPYSKFAHMFYRTLAIIWAKGVKRGEPRGER